MKARWAHSLSLLSLSALLFLTLGCQVVAGSTSASVPGLTAPLIRPAAAPGVTLWAASGATILFTTQNGQTVADVPPQRLDLPHLVLYRNGALSAPIERTLVVQVRGMAIPPPGVTVTLELATHHGDPDPGDHQDQRIAVWRESQWIANPTGVTTTDVVMAFTHEFTELVVSGGETTATPTDYFGYDLTVIGASRPAADPLQTFRSDYALLLENQWVAPLPEVQAEMET